MSQVRTYLDWNATAPLRAEARRAMMAALQLTGNPSSVHAEGRRAHAILETAREQVAALTGAEPHNVIFTSGATEAANHAVTPGWRRGRDERPAGRLYVSAIEHPCVLAGGRFAPGQVATAPVNIAGVLDICVLDQLLKSHDPASGHPLVAVMAANNETGIVQPVAEAATLAHAAGGLLICDGVQAAGRIRTDIRDLGADALLLSSHKLGGPQGAGALVLADARVAPAILLKGGGQERRQRGGTENVAAIAGFGAAAAAALRDLVNMPAVAGLRDRLEAGIDCVKPDAQCVKPGGQRVKPGRQMVSPGGQMVLAGGDRLPNTSLIGLRGARAETLVIQLDLAGVAVSAGAACSSGKVARSHVLAAMGIDPELAAGTIRVSLGASTTADDIDRFLAAWQDIVIAHGARAAA